MVCLNHKLINFDSESEGNKLRLHHGPVSLGSKEPGCRGAGKAVSPRFPQPRAKRCLQFSGCFWKILLEFLGKISGLSLQTEKENNQKKKGRAQKEDYLEVRHSLISQIFTRQVHSFSWFQQNSRLRLTLLHNHQKKKKSPSSWVEKAEWSMNENRHTDLHVHIPLPSPNKLLQVSHNQYSQENLNL